MVYGQGKYASLAPKLPPVSPDWSLLHIMAATTTASRSHRNTITRRSWMPMAECGKQVVGAASDGRIQVCNIGELVTAFKRYVSRAVDCKRRFQCWHVGSGRRHRVADDFSGSIAVDGCTGSSCGDCADVFISSAGGSFGGYCRPPQTVIAGSTLDACGGGQPRGSHLYGSGDANESIGGHVRSWVGIRFELTCLAGHYSRTCSSRTA